MKAFFLFALTALCGWKAGAQSLAGITNVPDTSYSTNSAWNNIKKNYPDAKAAPEFHSKSVKEQRGIVYCAPDGRNLVIDAFWPAKKKSRNGITLVIVHGGGWRSGSRTQHYPLAQHLADLGYTCFTPEYRLSTEALYPAAVHDVKAAIRWVRANAKKFGVDTGRIAVAGFSAGGQLAALVGTTNGDPKFESTECLNGFSSAVQAIVDLDGTLSFVHPETGEGDDSKKPSAATLWFGYGRKENTALWNEASPLAHVGAGTPPTLFINSGVARMHAGRDDFSAVLKTANIYTDIKTFADAPHHFPLFEPWFTPMVGYIDQFLKTVFPAQKK